MVITLVIQGHPTLVVFREMLLEVGSQVLQEVVNVELQAISHDFDIALNHCFQNVICEFGSQRALKFIQEAVSSNYPYATLVDYIQSLIRKE